MRIERSLDLSADRAERMPLAREATLRDEVWRPFDIVVEDMSETGCRLRCARPLGIGALVSVGVGGAGMQMARVIRVGADGVGCAFVTPLSAAALRSVLDGPQQAVVIPLDPSLNRIDAARWLGVEGEVPASERWSPAARLVTILGAAAASWAVVGGVGYAVARAAV